MAFRKKNVIAFVLTILLLGGFLVYPTYATDWFAAMKFGLDTAAKAVAQGAFRALSGKIFQKIESGGINGSTLFIQDWREFQLKSQYRGEDVFKGILKQTNLCSYFGNELKDLFGAKQAPDVSQILTRINGFDSFQVKAGCTMPSNFNLTNYQNDFAGNGGWNAWSRMLEPQNNYYGALFQSLGEASKQRVLEESAALNESKAGEGFIGIRDCLVRGTGASACSILGRIKTPGGTLGKQVASVFDSNLKFYTTADAASLAIATFTEFFINKLLDQGFDKNNAAYNSGDNSKNLGPGVDPEEITNSYKNEFCTVGDNLSTVPTARYIYNESQTYGKYPGAYRMFPPEENINSSKATDDNDVGKSYCKWAYDKDDNKDPYTRCIRACYQKLKMAPGNNLIGPNNVSSTGTWIDAGGLANPQPSSTPPPVPPPSGGTGVCRDVGGNPDYMGALRNATNAVVTANPGGIADALNTTTNGFTILNLISTKLQETGHSATTSVKNGNDNPNTGDLIAVWRSGDATIERYDAITNSGAGDTPLRNVMTAQFTGDIPLSCAQ